MKPYLFEGFDPSLRDQLGDDPILVTGAELRDGLLARARAAGDEGLGRARVLGHSFARIFYRNCINLGLLVVEAPEAAAAAGPARAIGIDTDTGADRRRRPDVPRRADRAAGRGAPVGRRARRPRAR